MSRIEGKGIRCGRCHHPFNSDEGYAGISLVPRGDWSAPDFRQLHICPGCVDALRSFLGILPDELDMTEAMAVADQLRASMPRHNFA